MAIEEHMEETDVEQNAGQRARRNNLVVSTQKTANWVCWPVAIVASVPRIVASIPLPRLIEIVSWAIVFVSGAYFTIKMSTDLIGRYQSGETTYKTTVMFNKSMHFPVDPTLCLSTSKTLANLELWYVQLHDSEIDVQELRNLEAFASMPNVTNEYFLSRDWRWPKSMLLLMLRYFTWVGSFFTVPEDDPVQPPFFENILTDHRFSHRADYEFELLRNATKKDTQFQDSVEKHFGERENYTKDEHLLHLTDKPTWKISWLFIVLKCLDMAQKMEVGSKWKEMELAFSESVGELLSDKLAACLTMEQKYSQLGILLDDVRQKFGHEILLYYDFRYFTIPADAGLQQNNTFNIEIMRTTNVQLAETCYKLRFDALTPNEHFISLRFNPNQGGRYRFPYEHFGYTKGDGLMSLEHAFDETQMLVILALTGRERNVFASYTTAEPVAISGPGTNAEYHLEVSAQFVALQERGECSSERNLIECESECQAKITFNELGCVPSSLVPLLGKSDCSMAQLNAWKRSENATNKDYNCKKECLDSCNRWGLKLMEVKRGFAMSDISSRKFITNIYDIVITIHCMKWTYIMTEEVHIWTLETFAGAIGGVLGLWLGIDLIVIMQFVFAPLHYIYKLTAKRGKNALLKRDRINTANGNLVTSRSAS